MFRRILAACAVVSVTALPVLAQETRTPTPAPTVQTTPGATETNLQDKPTLITPARKSSCGMSRQVMS